MSLVILALSAAAWAGDPPVTETEVMGCSQELNAVFAQVFRVPDNGKCTGYILDFEKKTRFVLPPQPDVAQSVVALGEDDERSSCQLRAFDAQLELKLKTAKNYTPEEKTKCDPYNKIDWSKPVAGFKDKWIGSLGAWLRMQRPAFSPAGAAKLYELGYTEAEDGNWLDAYDALVIATEWKPSGLANKESRAAAKKVAGQAGKEANPAKALMLWEIVTRLDPRAAGPLIKLAGAGVVPERAIRLLERALKIDPVLTTRSYREEPQFKELRCEPRLAGVRKRLPAALTEGVDCG